MGAFSSVLPPCPPLLCAMGPVGRLLPLHAGGLWGLSPSSLPSWDHRDGGRVLPTLCQPWGCLSLISDCVIRECLIFLLALRGSLPGFNSGRGLTLFSRLQGWCSFCREVSWLPSRGCWLGMEMGVNKFGRKKPQHFGVGAFVLRVGSEAALGAPYPHFTTPSFILVSSHPLSWCPPVLYPRVFGSPPSAAP